jgi:hypothetical protein
MAPMNADNPYLNARIACFNSGQRVENHIVGITEMLAIGKGGSLIFGRSFWIPLIAANLR